MRASTSYSLRILFSPEPSGCRVGSGGAHYFAGIFDGQNHRIYGMTIGSSDAPTDYASVGLFAYVDGGIIQNLGVVDASIYNRRSDNYRTYAGIIAGVVDKTETGCGSIINNCTVSGTIYNQAQDWSQIGGIAGYCFDSIIINCGATGRPYRGLHKLQRVCRRHCWH